jgi:hypothetical protein
MLVLHTLSWDFFYFLFYFIPFGPNFFLILKIAQDKRLTFNMYVVKTKERKELQFAPDFHTR